jgi:hypothetical protein
MDITCPNCKCSSFRTLRCIYEDETVRSHTAMGGLNAPITHSTTIQQTERARRASPPQKWYLIFIFPLVLFFYIALTGISICIGKNHGISVFFYALLADLSAIACFSSWFIYKFLKPIYVRQIDRWHRLVRCDICGLELEAPELLH